MLVELEVICDSDGTGNVTVNRDALPHREG